MVKAPEPCSYPDCLKLGQVQVSIGSVGGSGPTRWVCEEHLALVFRVAIMGEPLSQIQARHEHSELLP